MIQDMERHGKTWKDMESITKNKETTRKQQEIVGDLLMMWTVTRSDSLSWTIALDPIITGISGGDSSPLNRPHVSSHHRLVITVFISLFPVGEKRDREEN